MSLLCLPPQKGNKLNGDTELKQQRCTVGETLERETSLGQAHRET